MSVKSFQAKFVCDTPEKREHLWRTHKIFNEAVLELVRHLFKMRRGEYGAEFKSIYDAIRNSQNSFQKLEPITSRKKWRSGKVATGDEKNQWADLCAKANASGKILFDRDKPPFAFGSEFWRKVCEMAVQLIHSHDGLLSDWLEGRAEWQKAKATWEAEHADYMKTKPVFDEFEKREGQLRGSRDRWLRRIEFFTKEHPELAAWRGGPATVSPLTDDEKKKCRRPGDHFELLWEKNPELAELDHQDRIWRSEFRRFSRRPTWTDPGPEKHPARFSFKRGSTYKNLQVHAGTLALNVLAGEDAVGRKGKWLAYHFRADERLRRLRPAESPQVIGRDKFSWLYSDPFLKRDRPAEVKGIKLVFKGGEPNLFKRGKPYLYFSVDIADEPMALHLEFKGSKGGPVATVCKPNRKKPVRRIGFFKDPDTGRKATASDLIDGTRLLFVDLGQRSMAACSVCAYLGGIPQSPESVFVLKMPGLAFNDIMVHEKVIGRKSKEMYRARKPNRDSRHAPRGGTTFKTFRRHVLKMKEDRYKKAAHLILDAAMRHNAAVIVLEDLQKFQPDLKRLPRENRRLMQWNTQRILEFLDQSAHPLGIWVWTVPAYWSSRFCSACGHPGTRFSVPRKTAWKRFYERRHGPVRKAIVEAGGQFFVCSNPKCSRPTGIINADVNAALNFPKILAGSFESPAGDKKSRTWRGQPLDWKVVQQACQQRLDAHFAKKKDLAQQTPW